MHCSPSRRRDDDFDLYARGDDYELYARGDDYDLHARDDYDLWSRSSDGLYLDARDLDDAVTLLARELLYARMDEPKREQYSSTEKYEAAWKSWNRHNGKVLKDTQKAMAKHPQAGEPMPSGQHAFSSWNHDNRKVDHQVQNTIHRESHAHHKDLKKIDKKECKKGSGSKCDVM